MNGLTITTIDLSDGTTSGSSSSSSSSFSISESFSSSSSSSSESFSLLDGFSSSESFSGTDGFGGAFSGLTVDDPEVIAIMEENDFLIGEIEEVKEKMIQCWISQKFDIEDLFETTLTKWSCNTLGDPSLNPSFCYAEDD